MDIRGHAAIVTGGSSGLGAATARMLAEAGAKVAILDVNAKAAAEVAIDINGIAIQCDVADSAATEAAIAKAAADHGPARIVVNCAGIGTRQAHRRQGWTDAARRLRADHPSQSDRHVQHYAAHRRRHGRHSTR